MIGTYKLEGYYCCLIIKGNPLSTRNPMYIKPWCLLEAALGEVGRVPIILWRWRQRHMVNSDQLVVALSGSPRILTSAGEISNLCILPGWRHQQVTSGSLDVSLYNFCLCWQARIVGMYYKLRILQKIPPPPKKKKLFNWNLNLLIGELTARSKNPPKPEVKHFHRAAVVQGAPWEGNQSRDHMLHL